MDENLVVEMWSGDATKIRELVVYYLRAVERFREQDAHSSSPDNGIHSTSLAAAALSEALNWADQIDEYLKHGPKDTLGTSRDPGWASQLPADQAQLAQAFQHARNAVHHQWWHAVAVRISQANGSQVNEWFWGPLPETGRRDKRGDVQAYEDRLQGRQVLNTLDEMGAVFWTKRRWTISGAELGQLGHEIGAPLTFDDESGAAGADPSGD